MNNQRIQTDIQGEITRHGSFRQSVECIVDEEWGTISPKFHIGDNVTSGTLKYLTNLKGKKVILTLEVIDQ